MKAGDTLELRLVRGKVRAERVPGQMADVELVRHGTRSDPATVTFATDSAPARWRLEDRYPPRYPKFGLVGGVAATGGRRRECLPPDDGRGDYWSSDVRVEAVVRVPVGVFFVVHLIDGDVDVRALSGPRLVATNGGTIAGVASLP